MLSDLEQQEKERISFIFPCFGLSESPYQGDRPWKHPTRKTVTLDCAKVGTQDLVCFPGTNCRFIFRMELEFCSVKIEQFWTENKVRHADA